MKQLLLASLLFVAQSTLGATCEPFWGTVSYTDITDQGRSIARVEKFRVREWSPEEQFDRVLVKKTDALGKMKDAVLRVQFVNIAAGKEKRVVRVGGLTQWQLDENYLIVEGIDFKSIINAEASFATAFELRIENQDKKICANVFRISRGD